MTDVILANERAGIEDENLIIFRILPFVGRRRQINTATADRRETGVKEGGEGEKRGGGVGDLGTLNPTKAGGGRRGGSLAWCGFSLITPNR
jgi:hypothetical protein